MEFLVILGGLLILCFIAPGLYRILKENTGLILALFPLSIFLYFLGYIDTVGYGNKVVASFEWVPAYGINLSFYLDGLSLLFTLLISGIGSLIFAFAGSYMKGYVYTGRFYAYLILFMLAMLGVVWSGNLISLFLFWELTSISSFLLIGFNHDKLPSRSAALQALLITGLGGLALLAGFILLGSITGTYEISELLSEGHLAKSHALYIPITLLVLAGAFTKSAQFPFHFWLPGAMQAPAPVSAYLHSATMVKAGIFLLARLYPVLGGTPFWHYVVTLTGVSTMFVGAWLALSATDLKKILAYTTVSALGTLVMMLGMGTQMAIKAAMLFLLVHSLYKGTLFMIAGTIDKKTGTRDIRDLGGLYKKMPLTTAIAVLALLSMAGLPPMLGFIGKELLYEAKMQAPGAERIILWIGVSANALMVYLAAHVGWSVFFGKPGNTPKTPSEGSFGLVSGPLVLSISSLAMGLFPGLLTQPVIAPAVLATKAQAFLVKIELWHGFNQVFALSVLTVATGLAIFFARKTIMPVVSKITKAVFIIELAQVFNQNIDHFLDFAKGHTRVIQNGYHRFYLMVIFLLTGAFVWYQLYLTRGWRISANFEEIPLYVLGIAIVLLASTVAAVITRSRILAILSLGIVGYALSLIFIVYGAVDLAITLIMTETLIVILFVMVLYHLPKYKPFSSRKSRIRDAIIALFVGGFMTVLVMKADFFNLSPSISGFFVENSYTRGFGRNIVNVILVDFRALDTLGEITVLVIAAIGVFGLIKLNKEGKT